MSEVWKWFCDNFTPILITVIGGIIVYLVTTAIKKSRKIDFKGLIFYFDKFWQKLLGIKSSIFNRIQEKIVGKENLELLEEFKILKGNKRAIDFLVNLNQGCKISGVDILTTFINLYYYEINISDENYEEKYEKYKETNKAWNLDFKTYVLKELIKKYSK